MTRGGSGARWRVAARLARRQVRRAMLSSILIGVLIMLPIAAMTAYAIIAASTIATPQERVTSELGRAEAWIAVKGLPGDGFWQSPTQPDWTGYSSDLVDAPSGTAVADPMALLPEGTAAIPLVEGTVRVVTPDGVTGMPAWSGESWDPRLSGRFDLIDGRRPNDAREALATPATMTRLQISVGDAVTLAESGSRFTVVGTMSAAPLADDVPALFLPSSDALAGEKRWYLPEHELGWSDVTSLNEQGIVAFSRTVVLDPPDLRGTDAELPYDEYWSARYSMLIILSAAGVFAAYVVVMLAGAAFAVSARRQQHALAVAASVGASSGDLRRIVVLQGTMLGSIGGVVGAVIGVGAAALILRMLDDGSATAFPGFHLPWEFLLAILVFAVIVGTVSAATPAHTVARSDVLGALRGSRRPQTPRASRPVLGSALMLLGVAVTIGSALAVVAVTSSDLPWDSPLRTIPPVGIVVGPIVAQIGILLSGRWLLWITARAMSRIGLAARLAARDASTNASRTVPAFAAIAATVFIGVFALGAYSMQNAQSARNWFYQAPVGSMSVAFQPSDTAGPFALTTEQAADAETAARELAHAASATGIATIGAQVPVWIYPSADEVPDDVVSAIALLPDEHLIDPTEQDSYTSRGQDPSNPLSVIAPEEIETALGVRLTPQQLRDYRDGAALSADPRFVTDGSVELAAWTGAQAYEGGMPDNIWISAESVDHAPVWQKTIPAISVPLPLQPTLIAIAPDTAASLGIAWQPRSLVASFDSPPSAETRDRIMSEADTLSTSSWALTAGWEQGPPDDAMWMAPIIAAVATLVLGASAVALSLARVERRPDDATLSAVGGTAGLRRRIGFWQGLIIAGFGTIAGAAAGVLPPIGFAIQSRGDLLLADAPWTVLALFVLALPVSIALVSWLVPPRRPELIRRTAIA
ncbi:FtsX-like permease family protein [Microbacterium sp. OVT16B]|uniref:FtsX-like permease family protein n=1 Tax=Microbacterium sp. OVT16B TaxID=2862682 RepID=UPI001CC0E1B4|nr:FtsX-like permease family protein [Microbacterium sp. OVT16B]